MAEICCEIVSDGEAALERIPSSRAVKRRRLEIQQFKFPADVAVTIPEVAGPADVAVTIPEVAGKRQKTAAPVSQLTTSHGGVRLIPALMQMHEEVKDARACSENKKNEASVFSSEDAGEKLTGLPEEDHRCPKFGTSLVCGRRREMEDAVSTVPAFCDAVAGSHFFGVYDGHGCSHVALSCKDRLHTLVAEELKSAMSENGREWKEALVRSFMRMDHEVSGECVNITSCRCEIATSHRDAVGSTAVITVVTAEEIVVANCGDSRAVLSRNGTAIPLSSDHKPDRPDELVRIQAAGGRVIFWDCPRVLGVLAMSRAIGDNYLKPFVTCKPEVTVRERESGDECLILASDGLWDVMTNEEACAIASRCLQGAGDSTDADTKPDPACTIAATLLTKMALIRQSSDNVSVVVVDLRRTII